MALKQQTKWRRTVTAALAEETSAWSMIWALAEEAFDRDPTYRNISSGPAIEEIRLELESAGVTMAFRTIKARALVGKLAHSATKRDSDTIRSVPWTVIQEAVHRGASPEATAAVIRQGITTKQAMADHFRRAGAPDTSSGAPDTSSGPRYSDAKFTAACTEIGLHITAEKRGEYTPSPMVKLVGTLLGEMLVGQVAAIDWDAQAAELIAAEGGDQ